MSKEQALLVITEDHLSKNINLPELWQYRELLFVLAQRDVMVRYKQTALGVLWALLQPLTTMVIFSVIFGYFAKISSGDIPYPIFVFSGMLPWILFSSLLSQSSSAMLSSSHLIQKIYFPRLIIPISKIGVSLLDFSVSFVLLIFMMLYFEISFSISIIFLPLIIIGLLLTALGTGLMLSALTIKYRDVQHIIPFFIQIWMYITPVIYPVQLIPKEYHIYLYINPVAGFLESFRAALLGQDFEWTHFALSSFTSLILFFLGLHFFTKTQKYLSDLI